MPTPVNLTIANAPDGSCFTTVQALLDLLSNVISAELADTFTTYVQGSSTPSVDDLDKLWFKLDEDGRPLGLFKYYNGEWRRHPDRLNEVKYYYPPSAIPNSDFDGDGIGIPGGQWDGYALMIGGDSGQHDMRGRMPIGASSDIDLGEDGGAATVTLGADNTYRPARAAIKLGRSNADGNDQDPGEGPWDGNLYGPANSARGDDDIAPADAGKESPDPISIIPPVHGMYIARFVGFE